MNPRPRLYLRGSVWRDASLDKIFIVEHLYRKKDTADDLVTKVVDGHFYRKTRAPKLSRAAMLASRPTRNESLSWENNDNGEIQVSIKRQETWKVRLLSKFFYIPRQRKITLDEVGSEVWQMCNGRNSVGKMIELLSEKYQLNRKEAEVSCSNI